MALYFKKITSIFPTYVFLPYGTWTEYSLNCTIIRFYYNILNLLSKNIFHILGRILFNSSMRVKRLDHRDHFWRTNITMSRRRWWMIMRQKLQEQFSFTKRGIHSGSTSQFFFLYTAIHLSVYTRSFQFIIEILIT